MSSRGQAPALGLGAALMQGLAPDGGLYVPEAWPRLEGKDFAGAETLPEIGARLLAPFAAGDALAAALPEVLREAFDFPAPRVELESEGRLSVLELFHGPTAAFKDFGARFLAACFARLRAPGAPPLTILVATSGDTGGAVAAAFHRRPGIEVVVLFPQGLVSPTQERQLTCWDGNVHSFAVRGTFDDCQRLVKAAFLDMDWRGSRVLSSANSINLGRLLPQSVYYAATSLAVWRRYGTPASFIVPSGNLGNVLACLWARQVGLPIARVVLAHNANRTVPDYLATGRWQPRASVSTLASAMDVGDPSNMERLRALFPQWESLRAAVRATTVSDEEIRARIRKGYAEYGQVWCPHTATAAEAYARLSEEERAAERWVLVATAHPAKFPEIVEPLIGRRLEPPPSLAALFARPVRYREIGAQLGALRAALEEEDSCKSSAS
ncbi:MAG: threonine synthase [Gammaproteobacteria bacterium]|nr:threonine synthase [Gammaproteobacteria bacterium]MBV9697716.1 threonine synthase [Gammaproteobacteria bacterium]